MRGESTIAWATCGNGAREGYGLFYRGKSNPEAVFNDNRFCCARDER
jgi:hypothetical protein